MLNKVFQIFFLAALAVVAFQDAIATASEVVPQADFADADAVVPETYASVRQKRTPFERASLTSQFVASFSVGPCQHPAC